MSETRYGGYGTILTGPLRRLTPHGEQSNIYMAPTESDGTLVYVDQRLDLDIHTKSTGIAQATIHLDVIDNSVLARRNAVALWFREHLSQMQNSAIRHIQVGDGIYATDDIVRITERISHEAASDGDRTPTGEHTSAA